VHQVGFVTYPFFALQTADASGKPVEGPMKIQMLMV
jgi:hypothetical protein